MHCPKIQKTALLIGIVSMISTPLLAETISPPELNYYSDYGLIEQSQSLDNGGVSIGNDPFGYSDEYTDPESGLQYLQVRYYNPILMRFTQMDSYPLLNRYAYGNENPIMNDDPSGHNAVGTSTIDLHSPTEITVGLSLSILVVLTLGALLSGQPEIAADDITELTPTEGEIKIITGKDPDPTRYSYNFLNAIRATPGTPGEPTTIMLESENPEQDIPEEDLVINPRSQSLHESTMLGGEDNEEDHDNVDYRIIKSDDLPDTRNNTNLKKSDLKTPK